MKLKTSICGYVCASDPYIRFVQLDAPYYWLARVRPGGVGRVLYSPPHRRLRDAKEWARRHWAPDFLAGLGRLKGPRAEALRSAATAGDPVALHALIDLALESGLTPDRSRIFAAAKKQRMLPAE